MTHIPFAGTSPVPAAACSSAVEASLGSEVRTREAERGSWRASGLGLSSSGIGGVEGEGDGGILELG